MRLSKKLEGEIRQVYDEYMASMFNADHRKYNALVADNFKQIGTTQEEVWFGKKEVLTYLKKYLAPIAGSIEFRNRNIRIEAVDELILITEQADCYVKIDGDWSYYDKSRVSSVLQKKGVHWKFIQQHISVPDHRTEEGETIGLKKVEKEITELRDAIKRRTVELEIKNRELEIASALDKVRSVAMGMKTPTDMLSVCQTISQQLKQLGVKEIRNVQTAVIHREKGTYVNYEFYAKHDKVLTTEVSYTNHPMSKAFVHKMLDGPNEFFKKSLKGSKVQEWYAFQKQSTNQFADRYLLKATSLNYYWYSLGPVALGISTYEPLSKDEQDLFVRFRNVFELSYRRYLDIEQAEAQTREAQVEAALERVRSRTMAMHKSEDLSETSVVLFNELKKLGIQTTRSGFGIYDEAHQAIQLWLTTASGQSSDQNLLGSIPLQAHDAIRENYTAWKENKPMMVHTFSGKEVKEYYQKIGNYLSIAPKKRYPDKLVFSVFFFSEGSLNVMTEKPLTEDDHKIMLRFSNVFGLTYRRFLDLQKAESQAREAQIELALERVRAKTMAMQKPTEFLEVLNVIGEQFTHLGIDYEWLNFGANGLDISRGIDIWELIYMPGKYHSTTRVFIPYTDHTVFNKLTEQFENYKNTGNNFFTILLDKKDLAKWMDHLYKETSYREMPADVKAIGYSKSNCASTYIILKDTWLEIGKFDSKHFTNDQNDIFRRFSNAFGQAHTRFLDIQKAEAQAREAQVELGLERVRAKAMAMKKSDELNQLIGTVFVELTKLDIALTRCGIWIFDPERLSAQLWLANSEDPLKPARYFIKYHEHEAYQAILQAWKEKRHRWVYDLHGIDKKTWDEFLFTETEFSQLPEHVKVGMSTPDEIILSFSFNNFGAIHLSSLQPLSPEHEDILLRFARVFDLTYTRFNDLQKAEAQALEAIKRASVDRVRAEIASMRTTGDLARITPLIWNELTTLGVPFIRCGVFIMDEAQQQVHTYLSTPEGEAIAAFHQPFNTPGQIAGVISSWRKKEIYRQHWDESMFVAFTQQLVQQGAISSGEKYLTENRPKNLYLHFLPFLQGMLYVGNTDALTEDAMRLAQNLADAFSTAYARYEDFNKLEAAKRQVDKTLTDLKQAQNQLIHAEKMASLGELTAGIAHEIQNPLNFVNNFSEINAELAEELADAAGKGDLEEIRLLASDIKANQAKINEHGRRADAIVKSMLQHSRMASGQKEVTDINALADEYLRLAFHGMRAKDKSFNAVLHTQFDPSLEKIAIVPQEIGRVLLNLINNAFYAVLEKSKTADQQYQPTVTVTTSYGSREITDTPTRKSVFIRIEDNGGGIPDHIRNKIFQPFFTTKPTGQGTGLGLSLSYDIVKAHDGEINVKTKEGVGSEFIIQLPMN